MNPGGGEQVQVNEVAREELRAMMNEVIAGAVSVNKGSHIPEYDGRPEGDLNGFLEPTTVGWNHPIGMK